MIRHTIKDTFASPIQKHSKAHSTNGVVQQVNEKVRMSVEWIFVDVINDFKFLDFKQNLKIGLSAVGEMYIVGAILRNCLTCLYGNLTAEYFDVQPPVLEDYLR